ncbi:MAG: hypothetical protein ACQEXJ_05850 [Myxococcota bacterium]
MRAARRVVPVLLALTLGACGESTGGTSDPDADVPTDAATDAAGDSSPDADTRDAETTSPDGSNDDVDVAPRPTCDPADCPGDAPCTVAGCDEDACATASVLWSRTWGGPRWDRIESIRLLPDGGALVGASTASEGAGGWDARLMRLDAAGHVTWSRTWGEPGHDLIAALAPAGDGAWVATSRDGPGGEGGDRAVRLERFDGAGTPDGTHELTAPASLTASGLVALDDATVVVAGWRGDEDAPSDHRPWLASVSEGGAGWEHDFEAVGRGRVWAVAPSALGGVVAAGYRVREDGELGAWARGVDEEGALSWEKTWEDLEPSAAYAAAAAPGDALAIGGRRGSAPWAAGLAPDGTVSWERTWADVGDGRVTAMAATGDFGWILVGQGAQGSAWARQVDRWGATVWTRTFDAEEDSGWTGLSAVAWREADARVLVGGWSGGEDGGSRDAWARWLGAWGETTCDAFSACFGLTVADCEDADPCTPTWCDADEGCGSGEPGCDDGNPCTEDTCVPGVGCTHEPLPADGCDDGDPCTVDACAPAVGCTHEALPAGACDDEDPCTDDICVAGQGCENTPLPVGACDDGDPCTADTCEPGVGCVQAPDPGAPCDDGDACTEEDACDAVGTCLGVAAECDDGDECTVDTCDSETGCVFTPGGGDCDDENPCTVDTCVVGSGCQHTPDTTASCDDGSACTTGDACQPDGTCSGDPLTCDDENPCTADGCDPLTGCTATPTDGTCSDGDPCTVGDACVDGACEPGEPAECPADGPCTAGVCDPAEGGCTVVTLADGEDCDDGDLCTTGDVCSSGACVGAGVECSDIPCYEAVCDPDSGECVAGSPANGDPCEDGDPCTIGDSCQDGTCEPGGPAPCDDGDACTEGDTCVDGGCVSGSPADCDDGNPCTDDSCDPETGCVNVFNTAPCEDGDLCTTGDTCAEGECVSGSPVDCQDADPCTVEACDSETGACVADGFADGAPCDDDDACTGEDTCQAGACEGAPIVCDDEDLCTDDACDPLTGCTHEDASASCADDNPCTADGCQAETGCTYDTASLEGAACGTNDACVQHECVGGTCTQASETDCFDGDPCTSDACDPAEGCTRDPVDDVPCDDGDACTGEGTCSGGSCADGAPIDCADGNPCTTESCDPETGCAQAPLPDGEDCEDGDACTDPDTCQGGTCEPGSSVDCDDDNPCTADTCDPDAGCANEALDGTSCSTGCIADGTCSAGTCTGGTPTVCDDDNPCTEDTCVPGEGCVSTPIAAGDPCDDGDPCTTDDRCDASGTCAGDDFDPATCDDGDPCTQDLCAPWSGNCWHPAAPAGTSCDDGDACTGFDACSAGSCEGVAGAGELQLAPVDSKNEAISAMAGGHRTTLGPTYAAEYTVFGASVVDGVREPYMLGFTASGNVAWEWNHGTRPWDAFTAASRTSASSWCVLGDDRHVMEVDGEDGFFTFNEVCSAGETCGFQDLDANVRFLGVEGRTGSCLVAGYTQTTPRQPYVGTVNGGSLEFQHTFSQAEDGVARAVLAFDQDGLILGGRKGDEPRLWFFGSNGEILWDVSLEFTGGEGTPEAVYEIDYDGANQAVLAIARTADGSGTWAASVDVFGGTVNWQRPVDDLMWRNGAAGRQLHFGDNWQSFFTLLGQDPDTEQLAAVRISTSGHTHWRRTVDLGRPAFGVSAAPREDETVELIAALPVHTRVGSLFGDPESGDLGRAVALSALPDANGHPVALAGNPLADDEGQAVIWRYAGGTPVREFLRPPTPTANARFGASVALRGPLAVAGGGGFTFGPVAGSAHVFEDDGTGYQHVAALVGETTADQDQLGASVGITGDGQTILVGAPGHDGPAGSDSGQVHVWYDLGDGWTEGTPFQPSSGTVSKFGTSLSIDGDTAVIGGVGGLGGSTRVWVHERGPTADAAWTQVTELLHPTGSPEGFGSHVAIDGDTILVGQRSGEPVMVYRRDAGAWRHDAALLPVGPTGASSSYPSSVALWEDLALVGDTMTNAAFVFQRRGDRWAHVTTIEDASASQLGGSAAVLGDRVLLGAPLTSERGWLGLYDRDWQGAVVPLNAWGRLTCDGEGCDSESQAACTDGSACLSDDCVDSSCVHDPLEGQSCPLGASSGTCSASNVCQ